MPRIDPIDPADAPGDTVTTAVDGHPAAAFVPASLGEIDPDTDAVADDLAAAGQALDRLRHALAGVPEARRRRVVARQLRDAGLGDGERTRYGAAVDRAVDALAAGRFDADTVRAVHRLRFGGTDDGGAFRDTQAYITDDLGDYDATRLVVTPAHAVPPEVRAACEYVTGDTDRHPLVDVGLFHYQYLTVHPFHDGNGRTVRLLTDALLRDAATFDGPGISLIPAVMRRKEAYHDALLTANRTGDFAPFLRLFLRAVREQADRSRRAVADDRSLAGSVVATLSRLF